MMIIYDNRLYHIFHESNQICLHKHTTHVHVHTDIFIQYPIQMLRHILMIICKCEYINRNVSDAFPCMLTLTAGIVYSYTIVIILNIMERYAITGEAAPMCLHVRQLSIGSSIPVNQRYIRTHNVFDHSLHPPSISAEI